MDATHGTDGVTPADVPMSKGGYASTTGPLGYIGFGVALHLLAWPFVAMSTTGDGSSFGLFFAFLLALAGTVLLLIGVIAAGVRVGLRPPD